jgi:hypothetical protein
MLSGFCSVILGQLLERIEKFLGLNTGPYAG